MSHNQEHPDTPASQPAQRRPSPGAIINALNDKLNSKANEIRALEDREAYYVALTNDLNSEITGLTAAIDQVSTENLLLRNRLGLPETGPLELTDDEAAQLPTEMVTETADAPSEPHQH